MRHSFVVSPPFCPRAVKGASSLAGGAVIKCQSKQRGTKSARRQKQNDRRPPPLRDRTQGFVDAERESEANASEIDRRVGARKAHKLKWTRTMNRTNANRERAGPFLVTMGRQGPGEQQRYGNGPSPSGTNNRSTATKGRPARAR